MATSRENVDERVLRLWMANYKSKVSSLQQHLGDLLTQKKSLHSRVVAEEFEKFKLTASRVMSGDATPADVRQTLIGLEKALKKEGLFKNVKSGFTHLKKEFLSNSTNKTISKPPSDPLVERPKRSTTSVIGDTKREAEKRRIQAVGVGNDEVKNLNKAVGRLFDHLRIQKLSEIARESTGITHGRSPTTLAKKTDESDDFKEIIKKVRGLENELLRQKASQTSELKRLSDENKGLRNTITELRKEQEKLKGLQPITKAAKDRQVEKLEEQYNKQKRGMEGKIVELESELQENLNTTLREKAELEQMIVDGVSKLKTSITSLHRRICGEKPERTTTTLTLDGVTDEKKSIDILLHKITQIEESAKLLEEKNSKLGIILIEKDDEIGKLRNSLLEISEEVSKMHGSITTLDKTSRPSKNEKTTSGEMDTHETKTVLTKLQHVNTSIQQYKRILQEKEKSTVNPKNNDDLIPLKQQINKLYEDFVKDNPTVIDAAEKSSRDDSPKTHRERSNEINQLLQKLSRVEKACNALKQQNEPPDM
ncbi:uncharacterized protein LOC134230957 isoform X1 [Saccostrea cucullata]|uniref:uncharacterized protein LOC134230957 isoform X1 n=1 Tax=Saccostrea cuccullata TaxID=36930 RepID=UPI002ED5909F